MTEFKSFDLAQPILRAISEQGYTAVTPIQSKSIPILLQGHDLLGVAQTGTGKTAAFSLPLLHRLATSKRNIRRGHPHGLVLAPTRELACQIGDSVRAYGRHLNLRTSVVIGGHSMRKQVKTLSRGIHLLIATPGRLVDLMNQGHIELDQVEIFVLDEADRMLDMGFIHDVRRISAKLTSKPQTAMFSATMPKPVQKLADGLLENPKSIKYAPAGTIADKVKQKIFFLPREKKRDLLKKLLRDEQLQRVLIFTRTKHRADSLTKTLNQLGIETRALHGNKSQSYRQRSLNQFRKGEIRTLVATDIAARGIDVDDVTHVINFELPNEPDSYVHRIGRTARAGANGMALSFCDREELPYLQDIEKTIRQKIPVDADYQYYAGDEAQSDESQSNDSSRTRDGSRAKGASRRKSAGRSKNASRKGNAARTKHASDAKGGSRKKDASRKNNASRKNVASHSKSASRKNANSHARDDTRKNEGSQTTTPKSNASKANASKTNSSKANTKPSRSSKPVKFRRKKKSGSYKGGSGKHNQSAKGSTRRAA